MSKKHRAIVVLEWDEVLGEAWMNEDNLGSLLYSETHVPADLLLVESYVPTAEPRDHGPRPAARAPWDETTDSDLPALDRATDQDKGLNEPRVMLRDLDRAMGQAKAAWPLIRRKLKESMRAYAVRAPRQTAHNSEGKSRE